MLDFQPVDLSMKELVDSYTFKYGEGSCQHSFVSSFCLNHKYGDMFCEYDGFLYTLRSRLCTDDERVYLFPHGDRSRIRSAIQNVIDDAHEHNMRVRFETLTESAKNLVCELFPGKFTAEANRDYSEYFYRTEELINLPGHTFESKRREIRKFFKDYEGRYEVLRISPEHIDMIRDFHKKWIEGKTHSVHDISYQQGLVNDKDSLQLELNHFFELGLDGIVIFIDGVLCGYVFGVPLNNECFDGIAEKGNADIPHIYKVILYEFLRNCCSGYKYLNMEEDLGVEGIRNMKMMYKPEFLTDKFLVYENEKK